MIGDNLPAVIYYPLEKISTKNELEVISTFAKDSLDRGHISSIINAFYENTRICRNGIPYIRVKGVSQIIRTGNSGAERPLIYQGISGVLAPSIIIEIDGEDYISGPSLLALISTRISIKSGITKEYLSIAFDLYNRIVNLSTVRDMKDIFISEIEHKRPYLKKARIKKFAINRCEFTGNIFKNYSDVEFAHIESVVANPFKALDLDNGVIILKNIHANLTRLNIHNFEQLYLFCKEKGATLKSTNFIQLIYPKTAPNDH